MDDLTGKITEMLGNPETMSKVKGLLDMLGQQKNSDQEHFSSDDSEKESTEEFPDEMLQVFMKIAPLLSSMKKENKYTKFIGSLRPLLSEPRQKKLDDSSKILQLVHLLPILKKQELF